ncbi:sporulation protein YpjB [Metabacillus arenae]|uniref:Sporulation protein YpjB n=1 Tax=Metabacillus arenae TaxID=2771434 RepID=A0A926NIH7_9BACI|nr:sporulation protein YpjB [Metabacillus arenae]MBD1381685.1 sporulation protein YpjB [Metabacillus arenae]
MKKMIMILVIVFFFINSQTVYGETEHHWNNLNNLTETALQLAKQNRFEDSSHLIVYFKEQFENKPGIQSELSADDIRTVSLTHTHALEALQNKTMGDSEKIRAVTQFRLVVDAMNSEYDPLWSSMEDSVMNVFSQIKTDVESGNYESFQEQWNEFLIMYEMIYPSVSVDVDSQIIKRVDSHISTIDNRLFDQMSDSTKEQHISQMEEDLRTLFDRAEEDESDPSLLWVIISTGSIIILSLSYAGFRKYQGEKERRKQRDRETNK